MTMRWQKTPGPIIRKKSIRGGVVKAEIVDEARPGDLDLSNMDTWHCDYGGWTYVIGKDNTLEGGGYTASARPANLPLGVIGDQRTSVTEWLTDQVMGVPTFTEAERLCRRHARGRRDG